MTCLSEFIFCFLDFALFAYFLSKQYNHRLSNLISLSILLVASFIDLILDKLIPNPLIIILMQLLILIFINYLLFDMKFSLISIISVVYYLIEGVISILTLNIFSLALNEPPEMFLSYPYIKFAGSLMNKLIIFLLIIYGIRYFKNKNFALNDQKYNNLILITLYLILISVSCQFVIAYKYNVQEINLTSILLVVSIAFIIVIICYLYFSIIKIMKDNQRLELDNYLNTLKKEWYESIEESQIKIYRLSHDMKNQLYSIVCLLENNEIDRAKKYMYNLLNETKIAKNKMWTNNIIIDSIINKNIYLYPQIQFSVKANTKFSLLSEVDTCVLFANLIDNAVEASLKANIKNVELVIVENELNYFISLKNTISTKSVNIFKTTKKDSKQHGFGIKNIISIVKKYKGEYFVNAKDGEFTFNLIFSKGEI